MNRSNIRNFIALTGLSATALYAAQPPNPSSVQSDGFYNTAMGPGALSHDQTPSKQCIPYAFNQSNYYMSGCGNTASGFGALDQNTTGAASTATGAGALYANTSGGYNTAVGTLAMFHSTTGSANAAFGDLVLFSNTTGAHNTASGMSALFSNTTGSDNIAIGYEAGINVNTGNNNIEIGNKGTASDAKMIKIGIEGLQAMTFIADSYNTTLSGQSVVVTSTGQLGVSSASSERFKTDIAPMDSMTAKLQDLRPMTFKLKSDVTGTVQYGLVAEEVAKVYPELVIRDEHGRIDGVRYDELAPMLLNEVQKQQATIAAQTQHAASQDAEIRDLKQQVAELNDLKKEMRAALGELKSSNQIVAQR